ncbi:MAG TPA: membrane protein insertase YidC [Blastocatellia bacterium]|nr:membrane protein insertase YidC [Blastocatellia bacterium]
MEKRLILFLILSSAIFFGWSYVHSKLFPKPAEQVQGGGSPVSVVAPTPELTASPTPQATASPSVVAVAPTQADARQIKVKTDHWVATISNRGTVITDWTMTSFPNGKPIDPPNGINLIPSSQLETVGAPIRFFIPSDQNLEKELNTAHYEVKNLSESLLTVNKGEKKELAFSYSNNGVEASKTLSFKGEGSGGATGFDFDIEASVKRNGSPVEAYLVIGPNFGDQNVKEINAYRHAPQLTYDFRGSVSRDTADSLKNSPTAPTTNPVTWAAVDDNYFAMAIVPPKPVAAVRIHQSNFVSIAVAVSQGEVNHIYAGPKDLNLLSLATENFGLAKNGSHLEDIVSYGWLNFISFIVKPIAQFMLKALRAINQLTNNFGWSIVVLTIVLNLFFFPLRWKSSVAMKRAAAMQPQMKDLQERMKKLEKNDPRMIDLQKEQIALMKEGNPLMGCLPLLLQMPFFMAVFAILTVSIEVRHAPFIGWLTDLSSPDPYWVLPLVMCVTMILQQALTPTTADPVQKKVGYLMPLIFTWFLKSAPAGLVLYWMVSNLVGVVQQFIINRLNTPTPPTAASTSQSDKTKHKPAKDKKTKEALAN